MASPGLPESITAGVTTGHVTDHEKIHDLLNEFDAAAQAQATGDLLVFQDGLIKRLPRGAAGQVLAVAESGALEWIDPPEGGGGGAAYHEEVLADEPVFYYRLEELSGSTVADETGNSNDGTVTGATLGVAGRLGLAASFDGTDDYLTAIPVGNLSALTVECWVKIPNGVGGGANNTNIWGVTDAASNNIIHLAVNSNGTLALGERTGSGTVGTTTTATAWDDGEWHHIVAQLQAGSLRLLWIDGEIEAAGTAQGGSWTLTSTPLTFGGWNNRGTPFAFVECTLDEIAFYDKLLTSSRIVAHFAAAS